MCTVTWSHDHAGYTVWFNRDEQRTRPPAQPPHLHHVQGVAFLSPRDPQGGGTWLAVNQFGLTVGLLNYYAAGLHARSATPRSRGLLVRDLAPSSSLPDLWTRVAGLELEHYPPFVLMGWSSAGDAESLRWDGRQREARALTEADCPVTTSSFESEAVVARRTERFRTGALAGEDLRAYQLSRDPQGDAYSVWMSRPDAHTVSLSRVTVQPARITFAYVARGADQQPGPEQVAELPRR
jgi:hypothetical protein